jgi:hypothetical protein
MPAATASSRTAARSDTGRRSTTARSAGANLPPSSAAARSICPVSADTELSRSASTSVSEADSCSLAEVTSATGLAGMACSRTKASISSRTYSGLPAACAVSRRNASPGGAPTIAVTRAATSVSGSGSSVITVPARRMTAVRTCPHLQAVQHGPQRQPLGELIRHPPANIPPWIICGHGLSH